MPALAAAVLGATQDGSLKVTLLNKALYYLDLCALRDFGSTVTHCVFRALDKGPVVEDYPRRLIIPLERAGIAEQSHLAAQEQDLAARVARRIEKMTAKGASEASHGPAWQMAYDQGLRAGRPAKAISLHVAMQEILDGDPWLDEPAAAGRSASTASL